MAKQFDEKTLALFLGGTKKLTGKGEARELLKRFNAVAIKQALECSGETLDLTWYVRRMLDVYDDEETPAPTRVTCLDRIKEIMVLGAIQDKALVEYIETLDAKQSRGVKSLPNDPIMKLRGVG